MASIDERYEEWKKKKKNGQDEESSDSPSKTASYDERYKAWAAQKIDLEGVAKSIADRTNTWLQNHNNYLTNYSKRYSNRTGTYEDSYVSDASNWLSTVTAQKGNFDKEASSILAMLDKYGDYLDKDWTDSIRSALTTAGTQQADILKAATGDSDYWAQFATKDDYSEWQEYSRTQKRIEGYQQKYSGKSYDELMITLGELEDGEEKVWLKSYMYEVPTAQTIDVLGAEDFQDFSQYSSTKLHNKWDKLSSQYSMGYGDLTYEYINNQNDMRSEILRKQSVYRADTKNGTNYKIYDYMTEDEVSAYNYYYAKEGKKKAKEYLDSISENLEGRMNKETVENVSKTASKYPFLSSLASIVTSMGSGFEYIEDVIDYGWDTITGSDAHFGTNENALVTNAIRGTVAEKVDWEIGNWDAFDFLYNTAMSGADSLTSGLVFGGLGGTVLGLSAAAQGTNDALDRGMSDGQAFWNGLFSGVFEGLFETVSIGKFNKLKEVAPDSVKTIFKNLGKSMLVNASEEALTEIANIGYDTLINGEFANYTWEELKNGAWKDALAQVIEAGASGALMGLGMGAVGNTMGYVNGSSEAKKIYGSDPGALVGEALEIDPNNTFAQKMQGRLDSGKSLSGGQLNKLVQQNEAAMTAQDTSAIQSAAAQRLREVGATENVDAIAAALTKQAMGEKLTVKERQLVKDYDFVAQEMNPENIRNGKFNAGWAQKIGTNKINAQEYGRMLEAAQKPQEAAETNGGQQVVAEGQNEAQAAHAASVEAAEATAATIRKNQTVDAQQDAETVATGKESLQVAEESSEAPEVEEANTVTLEDASKKYGAQAQAMVHTYQAGQDVAQFDAAYQAAYNMGKSGVSISYATKSPLTQYLTEGQLDLAYSAGEAAANTKAHGRQAEIEAAANGKSGRKKGTVRGDGVNIADLKKTFNDTQGKAYKYLSAVAEVTGIDIVLYRSEAGADGQFAGAQGKYDRSEPGTLYIDLNAGLLNIKSADDLAKYAMLRTFSHEFTHFIENWNPVQYNEFRKVVFDTLTERGENVEFLIEQKQTAGMSYDKASREVVAEAMTDILQDSNFVQELAENHKGIFNKLLAKLKEFVQNLRDYFNSIGQNQSREANALKEQVGDTVKYLDSIVKMWDQIAVQAVENYQKTVATEEVKAESNAITDNEKAALLAYKSGGSYLLNAKLREGMVLTEQEQFIVDGLDSALNKLPVYKGKVYRNIIFDGFGDQEARDAFVSGHISGEFISYAAYTSTSTAIDGYVVEGDYVVHLEIESVNGRNLEGYGNNSESEVLFPRDTNFITDKIEYAKDGTPTIYLTEEAYGEQTAETQTADGGRTERNVSGDHSRESRSPDTETDKSQVQRLRTPHTEDGEMQPAVSGRDSEGNNSKSEDLQGVRAEVTADPYKVLSETLNETGFVKENELNFAIRGNEGDGYYGTIKQARKNEAGAYPVENAFNRIYRSGVFKTRQEAIEDIVLIAKISELLKREVTNNGENADNQGAVQQPEPDGRGAAPVLDELQTGDVPGDGSTGDAVGSPAERGQTAGRNGDRPDAERPGRRSGEGSSQSGDLRSGRGRNGRDGGNRGRSTESGEIQSVPGDSASSGRGLTAETLHDEVVEQIAQQSTEQPKGRNFVIGDSLDLPNGEKARYKANVEAIRLVKKLEAEGRYATEAEQAILSKYVGWGGLANAFDQRKTEWTKEFTELKELLTEEEYTSARGSTLNAHYTDISVIKAMYDGLKQLGFTGGRMMEPSSGVGNFVGAMPADMASQVRSWTMVELDGITGLIAKYLYPNADVRIQGFEKANIPNNFMDVAIGNVPFGNYAIADKNYPKKVTSAIHNYFFAKSLDKVRPGGIVMFITSSYTMNSSDSTVRRYIMQHADLLGAIRLPDTAFKGNAGTEVVTDILVLKKRAANTNYSGEEFLEAPYTRPIAGNWSGAYINDYFNKHPEMVLGTASFAGGMYRSDSLTYKALEGKGSLADQIREAFKNIQGKMDYPAQLSPEKTNFAVERAGKKTKENGLVVKDGKVYQNKNGELVEQTVAKGTAERITGMLEIRDAARELQNYLQQGLNEATIKKARQKLNKAYDAFVKQHGYINAQANRNAIKGDPDSFSILALENWDSETKKATKADIFSKNTIAANRTVTSAKDTQEGLIVSVNQTGGVDAALIAKLTGKTIDAVTRELIDSRAVFKNRDGGLETAEVYLSGNVRAKLRDAEAMVPMDADYQKNVEALRAVMPEDVGYQDIFVNPGTPWIPDSVYSDFAAHMLGGRNTDWRKDVVVTRNKDTGNFTVDLGSKYLKTNAANTQKWGTNRRSFLDLFDAMMNSRSVVVKDKLDDGSFVVNKDATAAANEKIENIQKEFQEWLWKDENRRSELATLYNEVFNSVVTPKYNGDNLTVNGANAMKPLRPHQRDAVQRIIASGGNTLLAHKVGAGKTYEMAAAAMKLKQLGLVKKPMFAVPKSLVAQWGNEFMDFFPTAKLLVAEASDFTAANRKIFMNRIANGDYDAVIVSYEQFEKLPVSDDFTRELYQEQIDSVIRAIEEAKADKGGKSLSVKDLEKKRKSLQAKIDKLTDTAKDEGNIDFEQLGVDSIFVDEAHNFKNLFYTTSMTNVSGLGNKDGSKRAFDLYTKVRYLQKLNGGRGIVFATATPVMNSMSEMYIMQKYLQPDLLEQLGLSTFDAWAKQFGEVVNGVEIKPSGQGYRIKQSFSRFKNMSELQLLFRNFADVLTDIPGLKIPKMKGGKVNVVVCEPGQFQQDFMKELEKRADNIKNVDPSVDNMLKITSDGRKISYTQRMIDPSLPYEEGCKIYRCADNVLSKYQESKEIKGTQIIFCDMATPKGKSSTATAETEEIETDMESAKLYDDIKARLIKGGIPAKEIAFIHEADTDAKKKKLFQDVNDGKVRVLIGSTGKMGVGMNAQKRIVAIHHLDAPWRPGDVEQRNGRAFRQGNINEEVENFTYVTEGSFDARLWDILERKQNFINQVMNGENVGRETEDTGEVTLSAAEVKALASGSPLIMEQVQLDTDIKKLESLQRAHRSAVVQAKQKLEADKGAIETLQKRIANGQKDVAARVDTFSEGKFSITVGKQKFTDKKDAGAQLMAEATAKANEAGYTTIGKFAGFDLRVVKTHEGIKGLISGNQAYPFNTYPGNTTFMINHLIAKVEGIEENVKLWEHSLSETQKDMAEQEKLITQPFAKQAELEQKRARYNEVMEILNPKEEQALDSVDEDGVQAQSREYLGEEAQQNQQRTNTLTDREVLQMAANEVHVADLSQAEREALDIFKKRLSKLEALQIERAEQGRLYKEQQFGAKVDREAAAKTLNRMKVLDGQIEQTAADVLSVEEKTVLKQVLQKARKVVTKEQWTKDQETLDRWRKRRKDSDAIKKYRGRLQKDVNDLTNWVLHPNNKDVVKHIPDVLKNSVIPFLSSIDFTSKQSLRGGDATKADREFMKRLNGLKAALKPNQSVDGLYADYTDLPPNFMERLQLLIDSAQAIVEKNSGEFVVNQMTSDELRELSQVVRTLKEYIKNFNKFHANAMFQHVHEAGDNTIGELGLMKNASDKTGTVSNFVFWQQIRPAYAFERFGEGGKAIYDGLRRGQAKLAFNTKKIQEFAEKAYTEAEVKVWEKEIKSIKLGGDIVKMPVSTIMSFYELSKRPQALGHILGQGIRVATYKANGKKISDVGHTVELGDVQTIIGTLTDRQKEVADKLQKFMQEQGGKWGNYVSVKRFGEELFGEDHYFPINSDGRHLAANADEHPSAASLYALLNMGFTKATTEGANNRLVLYSIFDVFANHMASMAQYNAFALPVVDAIKWFNYQQKSEPDNEGNRLVLGSVRDQMDRVYGVPEETRPGSGRQGYAQSFVINILKAFNGTEAQGVPTDTWGMNALRRYNMAQVAFNLRVVVQQPLAITRAALLIDYGSIIKGMKLKPAAIQQNIQEMQRYSGIAAWKGLGFYDVNISRGLTDIIKHSSTIRDKISEVGMWGAEKADTLTWAGIWSACKEEVIKKQGITPKNEGFYDAVTQLFEDVIYKTQVVDSVLTKNEYLRSKGFFARAIGSFMSEPTTTASMLIDAYDKYHADMQRGLTKQQAWKKNSRMIVRTAYVYGLSATILAAVQAVADALRDDDDYQEWYEKWLEAFGGNLVDEVMPVNKLPILSDFYEVAKEMLSIFGVDTYGNAPTSVFMQWYDSLVKGTEIIYDKTSGTDTNYTWYGGAYKLLQAASGMSGLPMAAATREIITAWNNIVGAMAPSLKVKTYDPGEKNEIKYAYQDGYLTADEAVAELLKQGLVDTEDEAYWTVQGWEAGNGYSRYDAIYDAVRNGTGFDAAMAELTSHGYDEDKIRSQVKSQVGKWYQNGEITKQQTIDMLTKYTMLSSEEITATVNKWSSKVVTGIAYEDIDDEFMAGNITEARAREMYVRYGGYTQEEATQKVAVLVFEKAHPSCEGISYAAVTGYEKYCEKAGVTAETFYDVWKYYNGVKSDVDAKGNTISGSKKKKAREYILSLDLSSREKKALLNWLNNW